MAEPELVAEVVCPDCEQPDCPNAHARRSFGDVDPRTLVGRVFVEEPAWDRTSLEHLTDAAVVYTVKAGWPQR